MREKCQDSCFSANRASFLLGLVLFGFITLCDIAVDAHARELRLRPELFPLSLLLPGPRAISIVVNIIR